MREAAKFTTDQIEKILELCKNGDFPDWHFGDDEVVLWEILSRYTETIRNNA